MPLTTSTQSYPVVFLDRDGVINQEPGPIVHPDQLRFIPKSLEAIKEINQMGKRCIVITNQAAFAKGLLTQSVFEKICQKLKQHLADVGGYIDDLFYCPHYPSWEPGRIEELCHPCECRKPGTLLFEKAVEKHNLSLTSAVFIGDTTTDFEAAKRLGIKSVGVRTGHQGTDGKCEATPDAWADDLWSAVQQLKSEKVPHDASAKGVPS